MSNPIQDKVRAAMTGRSDLVLEFDSVLNDKSPGPLSVFLHATATGVRVDLSNTGEPANILWLPWKQGNLTNMQPFSIGKSESGTLFFTYYLSGCKVLAIHGGPIWHIDAAVKVGEFWPQIMNSDWVEEHWEPGTKQQVAYLHRAGQDEALWNLSAYLDGDSPSTYGRGNIGQAIVGGVVNKNKQLDLYVSASRWAPLKYNNQHLKK